jgi:hypothetical protein
MGTSSWFSSLVLFGVVASGCGPENVASVDEGVSDDTSSSSSELLCRDLSAKYRVGAACRLGGGQAPAGTMVTLSQPAGCSAQVTLSATVLFEQMWNPMPPRFSGPYDMCALARFDAGSHGGVAKFDPAWHCEQPLPPLPPPLAKPVTVTVARSNVKDWSSRVDIAGCSLFQTGPSTPSVVSPPSTPTGPVAKLARSTFLRTATLGYDDFLSGGTVVALTLRPASITPQNSFTWVTVGSKSGFVATYDIAK